MPLPIAHGLLGATVVAAIMPRPLTWRYFLLLLTGAGIALLADFDYLLVFATKDSTWHRGFSHSILFSFFVLLMFCAILGQKRSREAFAFGIAYATHVFLDYVTTKIGNGCEILFPFLDERYGLRVFGLSEMPSGMSAFEIVQALGLEFVIFFPVFLLIAYFRKIFVIDSVINVGK